MARFRFYTASSLDGFLADPDHGLEWLFAVDQGDELDGIYQGFMGEVGAMVMGASTYLWMREHEMPDAAKWHEWYAGRPGFVVTHRDLPLIGGVDLRPVSGDVRAIAEAAGEAAEGKDVWIVGGGIWSVSSPTRACSTSSSSGSLLSRWVQAHPCCPVGSNRTVSA